MIAMNVLYSLCGVVTTVGRRRSSVASAQVYPIDISSLTVHDNNHVVASVNIGM